jgi:hypothetical protein
MLLATWADPSVEPLSTTTISGRLGSRFNDAKQRRKRSESFLTGTITETLRPKESACILGLFNQAAIS